MAGAIAPLGTYCSGGRRGLQVELAPDDLVTAAGGELAEIAAACGRLP